jgi:hypothetical protein
MVQIRGTRFFSRRRDDFGARRVVAATRMSDDGRADTRAGTGPRRRRHHRRQFRSTATASRAAPSPPAPPRPPPIAVTVAGLRKGGGTARSALRGSLTSNDGRLPHTGRRAAAGTLVGIQPITATAPGGFGPAYRLTPEGQTFAQPVTLTFKYSAAEAGASAPNLLRVATQTAQGTWSLPSTTHDVAQRTLSVATTHFSDWANVGGLLLRPDDAVVRVNKELGLRVILCGAAPNPAGANAPPLMRECLNVMWGGLEISNWSVNGIPGGNASVGTVSGLASGNYGARYKAPATVPSQTRLR